jgi:ribonuclease HI
MAYPNATRQYHLFVDAALGDENNSGGLGAVLMQDQEAGLRKPVAYASRRLDKHKRNYPVFLAEMQAAVFGMEQFHHFLIMGRFALYTDHQPLCKLSSVHVKTLNRLQLKMTELHPDIKYIEGKKNIVADFLSRYHGMNIHVTDVKSRRRPCQRSSGLSIPQGLRATSTNGRRVAVQGTRAAKHGHQAEGHQGRSRDTEVNARKPGGRQVRAL